MNENIRLQKIDKFGRLWQVISLVPSDFDELQKLRPEFISAEIKVAAHKLKEKVEAEENKLQWKRGDDTNNDQLSERESRETQSHS